MTTFKKYILGSVFALTLLFQFSCKKEFLEIEPKGQKILQTTNDYEQVLNVSNIQTFLPANIYMGDEMAAMESFITEVPIRMQRLYRYDDRIYDAGATPDEFSSASSNEAIYIRRLYVFNKVINNVMDSEGGTEVQKTAIMSEARVLRAICNFMFLSDFSKPYNASTATTDLGIPDITKSDVTQTNFARLSQKENYDLMIKDITEAIPNLGVLTHRRKISKLTAYAVLARIYFAMNNYAAAKTNLDLAFLEMPKANIPLALYDYNIVLNPAGGSQSWLPHTGFGYSANKPQVINDTETIFNIDATKTLFSAPNTFVLSERTVGLFDPADKRLNKSDPMDIDEASTYPNGMRRPLFNFSAEDVGPVLPDLYLMRAEARARANDLTGAVQDVQALRVKRTSATAAPVPTGIAGNQQALVRFILDERIRELCYTGARWLDMRRLSQDPIYKDHVKYSHDLFNDAGDVVKSFPLKPERFALKFGEVVLGTSQGLQENP
ncbi:SusD family protein [compost metagenome]